MKFLYIWDDWNLFHVEEVEVLKADFYYEDYPNEKCAAIKRGLGFAVVLQKYLFDTYEKAYQFGLDHTPKII